ncbi:putative sulfate exporter family transporter [Odoribacter sp. OttesenSCG-928-A06]|nr:putative sulfate exporter family transporter [Odoribacter sp. OttesenSCG-928-A06]
MKRLLFISLFIVSAFVSPAIALFGGIVYALFKKNPCPQFTKTASKYLLQVAVVGLGFGLQLHTALETGKEGLLFTVFSVSIVLLAGALLGKWLKLPAKLSYLLSCGTAICGGSAIAAVAPVVRSDNNETSVSLAVIFALNALALFIFPIIGHGLGMTEEQFGWWAAIAIHDTSSVVGAGATYGPQALTLATTVKLTRTLWIIPLSLLSMLFFRSNDKRKTSFPWFILFFIAAMVLTSYVSLPEIFLQSASVLSHKLLSATLFLIGSNMSLRALKEVGARPILLGIALWMLISIVSLLVIL